MNEIARGGSGEPRAVDPAGPSWGGPDQSVAIRIRAARQASGLSTRALATKVGVSQSLISQVERGECEPSLATLRAIAAALGLAAYQLFGQAGAETVEVVRATDVQNPFSDSPESVVGTALVASPDALFEMYDLTVHRSGEDRWFEHDGEEAVLVLSGSLEVSPKGRSTVTLHAGDSLHHAGTLSHRWRLAGDEPARVVHVVASGTHR